MVLCSFCAPLLILATGADAASELHNAIACLTSQERNLESFSLEYSISARQRPFVDESTEILKEVKYRFIGAKSKRRLDEDSRTGAFTTDSPDYCIYSFDGGRQFEYFPKNGTGAIGSTIAFPVTYFNFVYAFPTGLSELLEKDRERMEVSNVRLDNESLLQLQWKNAEEWRVRLLLNPKAAYQPRRMEIAFPAMEGSRGKQWGTRQTQVFAYIHEGSFVFPSEIATKWKTTYKDGTTRDDGEMRVTLLKAEPNAQHGNHLFEIVFPRGTRVVDRDTGLVSVVGQPSSATRVPSAEDGRLGVRAADASTRGHRWVIVVINVIVVILLAAAVIGWRRSRARATGG